MRGVSKPDGAVRARWLTAEKNRWTLADLSGQWIDRVHARRPPRGVVLDMDSSVSPTHGEQEMSSGTGITSAPCYHPLFVFNPLWRSGALRPASRQRSQRRRLGRRSEAGLGALSRQGLARLFPRRRGLRQS